MVIAIVLSVSLWAAPRELPLPRGYFFRLRRRLGLRGRFLAPSLRHVVDCKLKGGENVFCPFTQADCREDCALYDQALKYDQSQCALLTMSWLLKSLDAHVAEIASDTSEIQK